MDDPTLDKRVHTAIGSMHPSYDLSFLRNFCSFACAQKVDNIYRILDDVSSRPIAIELKDSITYELYDFGQSTHQSNK